MMNPLIARTRHLWSIRAKSPSCFFTKEVIACLSHHLDIDGSSFLYLLFSLFSFLLCFFGPLLYDCASLLHPFKRLFHFANMSDLRFRLSESIFDTCLDSIDGI